MRVTRQRRVLLSSHILSPHKISISMAAHAFHRTFSCACVTSPRARRASLAGTGVPGPSPFIAGLISQLSSASPSGISEEARSSSAASRSCLQSHPCAMVTGDRLSLGDRSTGDLEVRLGRHLAVGVVAAPWGLRWGGSASAPVNTGSHLCSQVGSASAPPPKRRTTGRSVAKRSHRLQSGLCGVGAAWEPPRLCSPAAAARCSRGETN